MDINTESAAVIPRTQTWPPMAAWIRYMALGGSAGHSDQYSSQWQHSPQTTGLQATAQAKILVVPPDHGYQLRPQTQTPPQCQVAEQATHISMVPRGSMAHGH